MKNLLHKIIILSIVFVGFAMFSNLANAQMNNGEVTLNGEVNPNGAHTTAWFEWGSDSKLSTWNETSHIYIGANNYTTPISANLSNLDPKQNYYFRIVTDNGYKVLKGNILSFKTSTSNNNYTTNTKSTVSKTTTTRNSYVGYTRNTDNTDYRNTSNYQNKYYTNQAASPILAVGFWPSNGFNLLLLILIIIAIIFVAHRLIRDRN